jgi:uncharacterized membrane protein required for colicin V production
MSAVVDLCVLGLVAGMIYALMSEGLWGAALMFFNALFAALIAFNFYEPLAQLIVDQVGNETVSSFADSVSMMLLFVVSLLLLRLATESVAPSMVRFPTPVYHVGRVLFAVGGATVTMGMLLLAYQASPVQKKMLGTWDFKHKVLGFENFGRFDRDFLAFFQYTSGYTFARNGAGERDPEFPAKPFLFDPKAKWLLDHQLYRPYGTEAVIEEAPEPGATPATPGGAPPGMPGAPPGMPGAPPGPGIPGGTAGAAAGLAPTTP